MRLKRTFVYAIITGLAAMLLLQTGAVAEVTTADRAHRSESIVYVAGNDDFYPVEYYNKKSRQYEGIMPRILDRISDMSGINFVYIRNGETQAELAENLQTEVVSAYVLGSDEKYDPRAVGAFSYMQNGEPVQIGWGFTEIAEDGLVNKFRINAAELSQEDINGFILAESGGDSRRNNRVGLIFAVVGAIILLIGAVYLIRIQFKRALDRDRMTDPDTGIGNLLYFENSFHKVISNENRSLYYVVYIVMDGNYLQVYHGEAILRDAVRFTAHTLEASTDENGFAARISESGFALAFAAVNREQAEGIIQSTIKKLNLYIDKAEHNDRNFFYAAAYNLRPIDKNSEVVLFNLRKNCSEIMGTDQQIVYCDSAVMSSANAEKKLLESILNALKHGEFKLYVQFVVDNKTNKIVSAEALSRWVSRDMGIILPGKYIGAMESSGYINKLDYYMFESCCRQLHKWRGTELDDVSLSCNITRGTLSEKDFIKKIKEITEKYVFRKEKLYIEITEESIEKSFDRATKNVRACKELGFGISLDDMGTGYTSLKNLCDYPIDIVKVDREILLKTDTDSGRSLFNGIVALAHSLRMRVICEGVETEEQRRLVDETDCDMIQGFYFSYVFPIREGEEFAKKSLGDK